MLEEKTDPRISVSKLGEYLDSSPLRRRRILINQKRPTEYVTGRYHEAIEAMTEYFVHIQDEQIIRYALEQLAVKPVLSEFEEQDRDLSVKALEMFLEIADSLDLSHLQPEHGERDPDPLNVGGVTIDVQPEVLLFGVDRDGNRTVGAIKLYLSRTHPLSETAADYVGSLLHYYLMDRLSDRGRPDNRACFTIDVFAGAIYRAPKAFKRRLTYIRAASEEIARSWSLA